jgi:hypothetical protein
MLSSRTAMPCGQGARFTDVLADIQMGIAWLDFYFLIAAFLHAFVEILVAYLVAVLLVAISPGPDSRLAISRVLSHGGRRRCCLPSVRGWPLGAAGLSIRMLGSPT